MKKLNQLLVCLLALLTACSPMKKEPPENIDHIILGINDLDKGIARFKELTGVEPVIGGIHPYSFTHNALVALDGETYIEIMAPRPDAQNVPDEFLTLENLTPIGWAVRTHNTNQTKEKIKAAGIIASESKDGSRAKPDGTMLRWTTFDVDYRYDFPFFIEWGAGTVHPSASSPSGCSLQSFHITTPDDEALNKLKSALQLGLTVNKGNEIQLQLTIDSPKGKVTF
jgi:Glyoxalase-like domain